jgi:kynurenine formamidase
MKTTLIDQLRAARTYDLGQPYFVGMPHFPTHPPFLFSLTKGHGDIVLKNGASSAAEAITLGGHVGTHIDALCHFSCSGKFYGGVEVESSQSIAGGFTQLSIATVEPIVRRGVMFDVAGWMKVNVLPYDFAITPEILDAMSAAQGLEVAPGDIVLLRTGWGSLWRDHRKFITGGLHEQATGPGPELEGARWLSSRGVFAAGSDTVAFERMPSPEMVVHAHLLVDSGIHIIECLNLEELARDQVREFGFIASPMKIEGGTGAPVRPLAIVAKEG